MPERSTLLQFVQLALETTPGYAPGYAPIHGGAPATTPPPAAGTYKRLMTMDWEIQPNQEFLEIRGAPFKWPVGYVINKDFSSLTVPAMPISYNEIIYILNSALCTGVVDSTGDPAFLHTFAPESSDFDTFTTYTLVQGDSLRAHLVTHAVLTGFDLEFSREGVTIAAEGFGQEVIDNVPVYSGAVDIPLEPILPATVDVYLNDTDATIGTTKLLRVVGGTIHFANRQMALWTVNSAEASFAAVYESPPEATLELHMEADAAGMAWLNAARGADTKFFRLRATTTTNIPTTALPYQLTFDMAVQVHESLQFEDTDGLFNVAVNAALVHDPTWGKAVVATVRNAIENL